MSHVVIIESTVGPFELKTDLPNGKIYKVVFKQKVKGEGPFVAEVPTLLKYTDDLKKAEKVFNENYAQVLINNYPFLRVLDVLEEAVIEKPVIVDKGVKILAPKKTKKENVNETVS